MFKPGPILVASLAVLYGACTSGEDVSVAEDALGAASRLTLSPRQVTVTAGRSAAVEVALIGPHARGLLWQLRADGLPAGVTAVFAPSAIAVGQSARLTLSVAAGAQAIDRRFLVEATAHHHREAALGRIVVQPAAPATFSCTGTDGTVAQSVTGALDAAGRPVGVTFTTSQAGTGVISRYTLARAADVAAADPNAVDVAWWAASLHMGAWDVTPLPVDNPNLDSSYLFLPTGAQLASAFPGFSYVLLAGGAQGSLQITLDCRGSGAGGGAGVPVAFACAGNDGPVTETIDGTFDAAATPVALTFTMARAGVGVLSRYALDTALAVAVGDPNAADLASFATQLGMTPWDVTPLPADNPNGDNAYVLFPTGAANLSTFQGFYYDVLAGGTQGNQQILVSCTPL